MQSSCVFFVFSMNIIWKKKRIIGDLKRHDDHEESPRSILKKVTRQLPLISYFLIIKMYKQYLPFPNRSLVTISYCLKARKYCKNDLLDNAYLISWDVFY